MWAHTCLGASSLVSSLSIVGFFATTWYLHGMQLADYSAVAVILDLFSLSFKTVLACGHTSSWEQALISILSIVGYGMQPAD